MASSMAEMGGVASRRSGALWWVLAAVACGLVAGYVAVASVTAARQETVVVMARHDVPPLTEVTGSDVALVKVPVAALPIGALRSTAAVVGRFARMGLVPGEMVTSQALAGGVTDASTFDVRLADLAGVSDCGKAPAAPAPASTQPQAATAPAGCQDLVAMALPTSADQGYQIIHSGDRVDVAASYPVKAGTVAQIVAANVPVIDKVDDAQGAAPTIPGSKAASVGATAGWLILGLSPDQALRVHLAETSGKVAVLLQAPGAPAQLPSVTADLVSADALAATAPQAPPAVAGQLQGGAPGGSRG